MHNTGSRQICAKQNDCTKYDVLLAASSHTLVMITSNTLLTPHLLLLLLLQCPLKEESEPALAELASASHMLVMITGDAPLTAVHAASQVHIVTRPVLVMQHK
jgi:P-type E1-E2 ATPase